MKRETVLGALAVAGVLSIAVSAQNQGPSQEAIDVTRIEKVKDNLYVITGSAPGGAFSGGNTAVFIGTTGVTLVDTKLPGFGPTILERIKTVTDKPVVRVINTHAHGDHTGGNIFFLKAGAETVVHENAHAAMLRALNKAPRSTFGDRRTIGSGPDQIDLYYFGRGHTDGDAFVVFTAARTMHAGDMFAWKAPPFVDHNVGGSLLEQPASLAKAAATVKNVDTIIHGHIPTGTWNDLREYADFTQDFVTHAERAFRAGKTAEQAASEYTIPSRFKGYAPSIANITVEGNMKLAYAELQQRQGAEAIPRFDVQEKTIAQIQEAIQRRQVTTVGVVEAYLRRIKAYNGTCVNEPNGILGPITTIPNAGQINALSTLNLRPAARALRGFDGRKARSLTDRTDESPNMPDALEVAAAQDRRFAQTGRLAGPLHGVVMAIKDQYDTFDMRTTSGADADYANDRPPDDATFVKRLRDAGAIILAKANLAEYAVDGSRSSFGGTFCNPYDTEREPGMSSAGSASSVAANLVTCAIGEETVVSIRWPAAVNSLVGLAPTQELVSRDGMMGAGLNMRTGPMCRTVQDAARVLDAIAGYDPKDEMTVFSAGRTPAKPYASFASAQRLEGVRIGVLREYMSRKQTTKADEQSIDLIERAIADLRTLGATVVDPGPEAELFKPCIARYAPELLNSAFARQYKQLFGSDDQIAALLDLRADPKKVPEAVSLRSFGFGLGAQGEGRYMINRYLRERGDANIKTNADLITKARFYTDPNFPDRKQGREAAEKQMVLDTTARLQGRFAMQTMLLQCMQEQRLDALMSPMSTVPPRRMTQPREPNAGGRSAIGYSLIGQQGFPVITVPAGFTTEVWDRERDGQTTKLVGPIAARLPVGVDFIARPFDEPMLFRIASAYEAATKHRRPPADFGTVR